MFKVISAYKEKRNGTFECVERIYDTIQEANIAFWAVYKTLRFMKNNNVVADIKCELKHGDIIVLNREV